MRDGQLKTCGFIAATLFFAFATPVRAAERWVTHGPWGGTVTAIVPSCHPDGGLFATVKGQGVFYRGDGAERWECRSDGIDNLFMRSLAQNPHNADMLFAGTDHGLFWTTDAGLNWSPRNGGVSVSYVDSIVFDPANAGVIYAAGIWEGDWKVYKTTDAGQTWASANDGIPIGVEIRAIAIDSSDSDVLYAATEDPYGYVPDHAGVYKTTDGGGRWTPSGAGILVNNVQSLAFDSASSATIYAGVYGNEFSPYGGVYVSHDAGASWTRQHNGLPEYWWAHQILTLPGAGDSTEIFVAAAYPYHAPPVPPARWNTYMYKSVNGGQNWQASAEGLAHPNLLSIAADRSDASVLYAGTNAGGVYRSLDRGATWAPWSAGLELLGVREIAVHPLDGDVLFVAADAYSGYGRIDAGVFASFDGGVSWTPRLQDLYIGDGLFTDGLAIAPGTPDRIHAAHCGWNSYTSADEGVSWKWRGPPHGMDNFWLKDVKVDPSEPKTAYAAGAGYPPSYAEIYKSTDWGESWTCVGTGLASYAFYCVTIDPTDGDVVYAGSSWQGIWKTTNGGASWTHTGTEVLDTRIDAIVVDPRTPATVYAADCWPEGTGVWESLDGGGRWGQMNDGLTCLSVLDITLDAPSVGEPGVLYAGTNVDGVFRRPDGGVWTPMNEGLADLRVRKLGLGPAAGGGVSDGRECYAGTDAGLYRRVVAGDLDGDGDVDLSDLAQLLANYGTASGAVYEDGDVDGDGDVDLSDLAELLARYGWGA